MRHFFKVYLRNVEGTHRKGRPLGRWEDRVKEHVSERSEGSQMSGYVTGGYESTSARSSSFLTL